MSYDYLLNLYTQLDERREQINANVLSLPKESPEHNFERGRQDLHKEFTAFLHEKYDKRLPRAIQKTLKHKSDFGK